MVGRNGVGAEADSTIEVLADCGKLATLIEDREGNTECDEGIRILLEIGIAVGGVGGRSDLWTDGITVGLVMTLGVSEGLAMMTVGRTARFDERISARDLVCGVRVRGLGGGATFGKFAAFMDLFVFMTE